MNLQSEIFDFTAPLWWMVTYCLITKTVCLVRGLVLKGMYNIGNNSMTELPSN